MTTPATTNPIPFSEPPWLCGLPSPYYTPSHRRWQAACRAFITENLSQHAMEWETAETVPAHVYGDFAKANMLVPNLPAPLPAAWLRRLGLGELPGGLQVEEFDYTHQAIYTSEVRARTRRRRRLLALASVSDVEGRWLTDATVRRSLRWRASAYPGRRAR